MTVTCLKTDILLTQLFKTKILIIYMRILGTIFNGVSRVFKNSKSRIPIAKSGLLRFAESPVSHISISRRAIAAPRPSFNETTQAYVDLIKNNRQELQCMYRKYSSNPTNEKFTQEFMQFLKQKIGMPYVPELRYMSSDINGGGMCNPTGILYCNVEGIKRLSELPATLMHEIHHFLQQKEIFSIISIKKYSKLIAEQHIMSEVTRNSAICKKQAEIKSDISELADDIRQAFEYAGWKEVRKCYPKHINPKSSNYKRAQQLLDDDLRNYASQSQSCENYIKSLHEIEAYDISVRTLWEFEHSIVGGITANEKKVANEIYDILKNEKFADVPEIQVKLWSINTNPYSLIETIRKAKSCGKTEVNDIIDFIPKAQL